MRVPLSVQYSRLCLPHIVWLQQPLAQTSMFTAHGGSSTPLTQHRFINAFSPYQQLPTANFMCSRGLGQEHVSSVLSVRMPLIETWLLVYTFYYTENSRVLLNSLPSVMSEALTANDLFSLRCGVVRSERLCFFLSLCICHDWQVNSAQIKYHQHKSVFSEPTW